MFHLLSSSLDSPGFILFEEASWMKHLQESAKQKRSLMVANSQGLHASIFNSNSAESVLQPGFASLFYEQGKKNLPQFLLFLLLTVRHTHTHTQM